jgi:hypothetical protein
VTLPDSASATVGPGRSLGTPPARGLEFAENEPPWVSWVDRGRRRQ